MPKIVAKQAFLTACMSVPSAELYCLSHFPANLMKVESPIFFALLVLKSSSYVPSFVTVLVPTAS
jgi:hypothetical protein